MRIASLLDSAGELFDVATRRAAQLCTGARGLDPTRLDQHQWLGYELAWTCAELTAARAACSAPGSSALQTRLEAVFAADTLVSVLARLQGIYIALSLDAGRVQALLGGRGLVDLRRQITAPEPLAEVGLQVIRSFDDLEVVVDDEVAMARETFRSFAADAVAPLAERIHREDLTVPESILQPLREMGVFGLSIPEEYGGSSPSGRQAAPMMVAVTEALSEASLGAAGSLITRPEILARALMAGGTAEQKMSWLPKIAAGDPLCAVAITEPDYGSDVASLALRATRVQRGWLLNGAKTWCTFAGKAGLLMVVARTDPDRRAGHKGLSVLLVEKPSYDGREFHFRQSGGGTLGGRAIRTLGYRGMHSFDLVFEDFFVPEAHLIGGEAGLGRGFYLTMAGMTGGRLQTAGRALGLMRAAIRAAVQYARHRKVFNTPLMDFPLTRVKLATMAARFVGCRQMAYTVAAQLDRSAGAMEASLVKLLACRSAELIAREAQQIHGGMGYAEESAVSRYFLDARVLSIFEGSEETLALKVIAKGLLDTAAAEIASSKGLD